MTPGVRRRRSTEPKRAAKDSKKELVILTGISGSGKASALKAFEDMGYQAVDNLPLELLPEFSGLVEKSKNIERAAIVVDVRASSSMLAVTDSVRSSWRACRRSIPAKTSC